MKARDDYGHVGLFLFFLCCEFHDEVVHLVFVRVWGRGVVFDFVQNICKKRFFVLSRQMDSAEK